MPGYSPLGRHHLKRRAKSFDAALNRSGLNRSGLDSEAGQVADRHIRELVRTAEALTREATCEPDPQFVGSLRTALMTEADSVLRTEPIATTHPTQPADRKVRLPVRRRLVATAAAALIVASGGGAIASSTQAMPGDFLYPVKLRVESAQSGLHFSDISKGGYELELASKRLDEASALIGHDADPELIATTLTRFTGEAGDGAALLFAAHEPSADEQPVQVVQEFAESADKKLSALRTTIPAQASQEYREAVATLRSLSNQVSTLCADCDQDSISSIRSSVSDKAKSDGVKPDGTKSDRAKSDRAKNQSAKPGEDAGSSGRSTAQRSQSGHGPSGNNSGTSSRHSGADDSGDKRKADEPDRDQNSGPSREPSSPGLLDPVTGLLSDLLG